MQRKADEMEGIRYYMPRPFVNVYESFPIATDVYIADGEVSPDGTYVMIQNVRSESPLGRYFVSPQSNNVIAGTQVPTAQLGLPNPEALKVYWELFTRGPGASPHSGTPDAGAMVNAAVDKKVAEANAAASAAKLASADATAAATQASATSSGATPAKTGQNERKVTNVNGAFAFQPLRGNMDLVYLPDFDEQYVVRSKSGLGNAKFDLTLGQGWSLQGLSSLSDNSELNKLMFELIGTAVTAAKAIASSGTTLATDYLSGLAKPHRGAIDPKEVSGTKVSLRVTVVYYAAKGLYPVIKPRELKDQPRSTFLLNLADNSRVGQGLRAIQDAALQAEMQQSDANQGRFTVPVYPYQYISFNTFRYMAIEVVTKNGVPFGTLYPETGTAPGTGRPVPPMPPIPPLTDATDLNLEKVEEFIAARGAAIVKSAAEDAQADAAIKSAGFTDATLAVAKEGTDAKARTVALALGVAVKTKPADAKPLEEAWRKALLNALESNIDWKALNVTKTQVPGVIIDASSK